VRDVTERKHGVCDVRCEESEFWIYLWDADCGIWGELLSFPRSGFCYVEWFGYCWALTLWSNICWSGGIGTPWEVPATWRAVGCSRERRVREVPSEPISSTYTPTPAGRPDDSSSRHKGWVAGEVEEEPLAAVGACAPPPPPYTYSFFRADFRFSSLISWLASRSLTSRSERLAGMMSSSRSLLSCVRSVTEVTLGKQ
jgi:hypothetical protein